MKCLRYLTAAALLLVATGPAFAADVVYPTGVRLGMTPLVGLVKAKTFTGFETEDHSVKVLVTELPPSAYNEVKTAFSKPDAVGPTGIKPQTLETAGAGTAPVLLGIEALKRKAGVMVVQGEMAQFPNFPIGRMTVKFITLKSARGHSYKACELALQQLASKRFPLIFRH